ncbi:deoxyuridine 5'-triphosphate nucleotidohydrolase [Escherichia phage vB_Eco_SLUR75]|nr:deoxyuridine 5'-triphosphate nucleotidohydrolase [Escherichia phage vB_Eco_SLUR75]
MTDVLNNMHTISMTNSSITATSFAPTLLGVKRLTDTAILPSFASAGAACFDLHADLKSEEGCEQIIFSYEHIFRTGLAFDIPEGYALMLYSRSGHGFKNDVRLANCVGVIDSDYTGELKVKITIDNDGSFTVNHGDRIAQAMLIKLPSVQLVEVDELKSTERGANGFGSTGTGELKKGNGKGWKVGDKKSNNFVPATNVVTSEEEVSLHPIMTSRYLK